MTLVPDGPASSARQQELDFSRADFRERLIRGLPIGARLRDLLLAVDQLADLRGIREGGLTIVEAKVRELHQVMGCSERTFFGLLRSIREKPCRYLAADSESGRPSLYSIFWGPVVEDSRPVGHLGTPAIVGVHPCKTPATAGVQKPGKHASKNASNAHESFAGGKSKSKTGGWDGGGLTPSELSDLDRLRLRFKEAVRKGWLMDASQEWEGFAAAACQALAFAKARDPRRVFSSFVKRKAWRESGKGGLPESAFDKAAALLRPARVPPHPDLANGSAEPLGEIAVACLQSRGVGDGG